MTDFIIENGILKEYRGRKHHLVIPDGVTVIHEGALFEKKSLKSVVIPNGVKSIGDHAFDGCANLESITIPDGVETIGQFAFYATALKTIVMPDSVTEIGGSAFSWCRELTSVTIGNGIRSLSDSAFLFSANIKKYVLAPDSKDEEQCKAILRVLNTETLAEPFLLGNIRTNPIIEKRLKSNIVSRQFRTEYIPELIISKDTALLGRMLPLIRNMPLEEIDAYLDMAAESGEAELTVCLMEYKQKRYPPEKIEEINRSDFEKSIGLREKTLADYRKEFKIYRSWNGYTITACKGKSEIVEIPGTIRGIPVKIGMIAFAWNIDIRNVLISEGVTGIGQGAFWNCVNMQTVTLPESLITMEDSLFFACSDLRSITIPRSVKTIGTQLFCGCYELSEIQVSEENPNYHSKGNCIIDTEKREVIAGCHASEIPEGVTSIGETAFQFCPRLISIHIPDGVTSIGQNAFSNCELLESVRLPDSLTSLGDSVFSQCSSLTQIELPRGLTNIPAKTFELCCMLERVAIPEGVTVIEKEAFRNCTALQSITIPDSVSHIGKNAFADCQELTIRASKGSAAQDYAIRNHIPFQEI